MAIQFKSSTGFDYVSAATPLPVTIIGGGTGDVDGPASATDNAIARFDGTTGKLIQNSVLLVADTTGALSGFATGAGITFHEGGAITGASGSLDLTASGTNQNITLTPSGTGYITLGGTTGGVRIPSTNTAGLQLYNTVDQVTNAQRLEVLYGSSVARLGTRTIGTAASTPLHLFVQGDNADGSYSRIDVQRAALPFFRHGVFSGATGTTNSNAGGAGTFVSFGNVTSTTTSGTVVQFAITPTYNQNGGTASNTDLLINRTETTAPGSGAQYLIQAQVGGSNKFLVTNAGQMSAIAGVSLGSSTGSSTVNPIDSLVSTNGEARWKHRNSNSGTAANAYIQISNNDDSGIVIRANSSGFTTAGLLIQDGASVLASSGLAGGLVVGTQTTAPLILAVNNAEAARFDGASGGLVLVNSIIVSTDTLSGAGAVSITKDTTKLTSTGAAEAITLADGTDGQIKRIIHDVDGGSMVLTPTTKTGWSTATFTNAGDSLTLEFVTTRGWIVMASYGTVVAP